MRGFDCLIIIDGKPVAAQINAQINRQTKAADISNKIKIDWEEKLPSFKNWTVTCNGAFVLDDECLIALEDAFLHGTIVEVKLDAGTRAYKGNAFVVSFPIGAAYNKAVSYSIQLQGTGELNRVEEAQPEV